jgi:hypothetical protein
MPTYSKLNLSPSLNGRPILITASGSPGTVVHTAVSGVAVPPMDEVWIYATNGDSAARTLTLQWGGTISGADTFVAGIPSKQGLYLLVPGFIVYSGVQIRAYSDVGSKVTIDGFINRIT